MADVFLSYAREDMEKVRSVAGHLEAHGWTVFWDATLRDDQEFSALLLEELRRSRCVVVVWSRASIVSSWIRDEARRGRDRGILVQALIEDVKIPLGFGHLRTGSLVGWTGSATDPRFQRIVEAIAAIVPTPEPSPEHTAEQTTRDDSGSLPTDLAENSIPVAVPADRQVAATLVAGTADLRHLLYRYASDPKARARAVHEFCQRYGDPRFRRDGWFLPIEPMLGFIEIPAGPFTMGSDTKVDNSAYDDELSAHSVMLPTFYIARFPVTVAQFNAFAKDKAGNGGFAPGDPDCLLEVANHPVVRVSWHEALAYCDWLTQRLAGWPETPEALARVLRPTGKDDRAWRVTLASEAEWEKAARGTDGRIYPWGARADPNKANYDETRVGFASVVGCFPGGASRHGVEDMSGNVCEWTRSLWGKDSGVPTFTYPYQSRDGREDSAAGSDILRVVRGGAFGNSVRLVRAANRLRRWPDFRNRAFGFRVVISPFFSEP